MPVRNWILPHVGSVPNVAVAVPGAYPTASRLASRELGAYYKALGRRLPEVHMVVHVPKDLDAAVRETVERSRHTKSGFVAMGRHGTVDAVTIPMPADERLGFAILFNPELFGPHASFFKQARRRVYAHEEGHVLDYVAAYPQLGAEGLFLPPTHAHMFFRRKAFDFAAEYRADRWMVADELRVHRGRYFVPSRFLPSFEGAAYALEKALDELPAWLVYITGSLGKRLAFREFLSSIFPRLDEVLTYTAYMCAREDALRQEYHVLDRLRKREDLAFYFRFLDGARPKLRAVAEILAPYDVAGLDVLAASLIPFFHACGMDFRDEAGQLQVSVRQPPLDKDDRVSPDDALRNRIRELERVGTDPKYSHRIRERARERLVALAGDAATPEWAKEEARQAADRVP